MQLWQVVSSVGFVLLGVVLTLVLQVIAGRQTKEREREARLFDARREVYAKVVGHVDVWVVAIAESGLVPITDEGTNEIVDWITPGVKELREITDAPVKAQVELMGSSGVQRAVCELLEALEAAITGVIMQPDGTARTIGETAGRVAVPKRYRELRAAMRADLGL